MKALALLSGGLDSTLAIRVIQEQGIEVVALNFFSPFCLCDKKARSCSFLAKKMADQLGVQVRREYLGDEYLEIVRAPRYGYGKNLNPCIDCRILMFKKTKELMQKIKAQFIVTGEVLGQRPKSQYKKALKLIESQAGLENLIVRPLSAKLLDETIPEKKGWIDRDALLDFYGRTRKPQNKLARVFGIKDYPCSSGGCLLTDISFSRRLKDLLDYGIFDRDNVELLKLGRHFRISAQCKLIVGGNTQENNRLFHLAKKGDLHFEPAESKEPYALGRGVFDEERKFLSAGIVARYVYPAQKCVRMKARIFSQKTENFISATSIDETHLKKLMI